MEKEEIIAQIEKFKKQYGNWTYDIPLPFDIWTNGNINLPHTRLKRIVQIVNDLVNKPLSKCRILDLGSLDGMFSIEFAQQGAETVGIEIREENIKKAVFCKEVLKLNNLSFIQGDARSISVESNGTFDAIICSGLLYHLSASEAIGLIAKMFSMSRLVIIDTHIALDANEKFVSGPNEYWGKSYREHKSSDSQDKKAKRTWASWDNNESFWFTRPSLINILNNTGFSSVYECFTPTHLNYGKQGLECFDRCTFVSIKSGQCKLVTSPAANELDENWPENTLNYNNNLKRRIKSFHKGVRYRIRKIIKG